MVYFDIALGRYGDATPLGRILMEVRRRQLIRAIIMHAPIDFDV